MNKTILCIGAGYVGGPTMAVIAAHCPEYKVIVADIDGKRIAGWQSENPPIYEPGLKEVVDSAKGRNLFFTTDIAGSIKEADLIFVSVNTPTKSFGAGAGKAADLQYWEKTARDIIEHAQSDKIVIEKSTLPVRTAAAMYRILSSNTKGLHFDVISNPEFMAEGTAIDDLNNPDRVLIGCMQNEQGLKAIQAIVDIYRHWVPEEKIITTNLWSSELSKLAANAMLAQRVSSVNSLSALCEETGADIAEVSNAMGLDSRIGGKFLKAGVGFGGSCFKKDILNLVYLCEHYGLPEVAAYWEQVVKINQYQQERFVGNLIRRMFNTISGKKIAVFGFAFKSDTGDTRESPAINICRLLLGERAKLTICDPQAMDNARKDMAGIDGDIEYVADPYEAAKGAHAIAVLTDWKCFRELDFKRLFDSMEKPAFLFDGRNFLNHRELFELGFNVYGIGKPGMSHLTTLE